MIETGLAGGVPIRRVRVGIVEQAGEIDDVAPFLPIEEEVEGEVAPDQPVAEVDQEVGLRVADLLEHAAGAVGKETYVADDLRGRGALLDAVDAQAGPESAGDEGAPGQGPDRAHVPGKSHRRLEAELRRQGRPDGQRDLDSAVAEHSAVGPLGCPARRGRDRVLQQEVDDGPLVEVQLQRRRATKSRHVRPHLELPGALGFDVGIAGASSVPRSGRRADEVDADAGVPLYVRIHLERGEARPVERVVARLAVCGAHLELIEVAQQILETV